MDQASKLRDYFLKEKRSRVLDVQEKLRNSVIRGEAHEVYELLIQLEQAMMEFEGACGK